MPAEKTLLTAAFAAPIGSPTIRDGGVVFQGEHIIAWDHAAILRDRHLDATVIDLGNTVIVPGLINAHTHLELSSCSPGDPPASFVDWILRMPRRIGREVNQRADDLFAASTRAGIEQCLKFGVTCVGDISQQIHVTRPILRDSPLRAVSFGEVIGLGKRRSRFEELLPIAIDRRDERTDHLIAGLTPHSPYTVEPDGLRRCVKVANEQSLPLAIHLAETAFEREFLRSHTGPLREMWDQLGSWEDFPETYDGSPVSFAKSIGLLDRPTLLAHVNYCDERDVGLLKMSKASVVYCPRTHRYFGHPTHFWTKMIGHLNIAIGTDSCASSPDLNLVDELRIVHKEHPSWPARTLWSLVTRNAARAIQWPGDYSALADFVVFDCSTEQPLRDILESDALPREVWIAGELVHTR